MNISKNNMRHRRQKRFRHRSNGRNNMVHFNGAKQTRLGSVKFLHDRGRNGFKPHQSAEKLMEKYSALAKEALSSGDRILSENYLQHVDHFKRIIDEKNLSRNNTKEQNETSAPAETKPVESMAPLGGGTCHKPQWCHRY